MDEVKLLVVDDDADNARSLADVLAFGGYSVEIAHDALSAERMVSEFHPLAVLIDLNLPQVDGYELAGRLRSAHGNDVVLIAVTGTDERDARAASLFALVDHHFLKPVDLKKLHKVLPPLG